MTPSRVDPRTKYYNEGFVKQEQDQPGLTPVTEPRPDTAKTATPAAASSPACVP